MINLFTDCALIKSAMREARRIKPVIERAAIKIQKDIDYAAEHGLGDAIVYTDYFCLAAKDRETIMQELQKAGYNCYWHDIGRDNERVHVWREETNEDQANTFQPACNVTTTRLNKWLEENPNVEVISWQTTPVGDHIEWYITIHYMELK